MTVKINGTNTVANPAFTGADTDTGLQCGTNEVKLVTGGTARATVDSSGNVLVGKTSSSGLNAGCEFRPAGMGLFTRASANPVQVRRLTDDGDLVELYKDSTLRGSVGVSGTALTVGVAGTERLRILSGGGLTFNGDTAQANALDDYEEGTWTPTLTGSSYAPSLTYNTRLGEYVKIGSLVYLSFFIQVANVSAQGGGQLRMTGLPFSAKNSTGAGEIPGLLLQSEPFTSGDGANRFQMVRTAPSQAQFYLLYKDLTTGQTHIDSNSATAIGTGYMIGNITYRSA